MNRLAFSLCVLAFSIGLRTSSAEEPYREWLDFYEGKWRCVDPEFTVEFRYTKGRSILYSEVNLPWGIEAFVTYAWDAGKKALVFSWFDSTGEYVRQEYTVFKQDMVSGLMTRSGPDGPKTGNVVVHRFGPDKYKVTLKIADAEGNITEQSVEAIRQK